MYAKTTVIGNVGRDPELRYTPSGRAVCDFSVAANRRYKTSDGEQREETTWYRVTAWAKLAETVNTYVRKGMLVMVEGRVNVSAFLSQDGTPRATLELTAENIKFLSKRNGDDTAPDDTEISDDELPF